jgi:hypothetical protein
MKDLEEKVRTIVRGADMAGVELHDGNVVDLCADNLPSSVTLLDIRMALKSAGFKGRFPGAIEGKLKDKRCLCGTNIVNGKCSVCWNDARSAERDEHYVRHYEL